MIGLFDRWSLDWRLVIAILGLTVFGILMIYSAGVIHVPNSVTSGAWVRQSLWFVLALGAFTVMSRVPRRWIEWASVPSYVLSVVLLAATLVLGSGRGTAAGVKSWIDLGFISFQPAEIAKLSTVLILARLLSRRTSGIFSLRDLLPAAAIVALPLGLVMLQPDLGTAMAFVGIFFAMLYWAATPVPLLLLLASPVAGLFLSYDTQIWSVYILAVIASLYFYRLFLFEAVAIVFANFATATISRPLWNSLAAYQKNRILVYFNPEVDPRGAGYHVIQSKVAVGSGGFGGQGFTLGSQKRLDFLPEQHTDFIFSVIGEELGFVGTGLTILCLTCILTRLVRMAERAPDPFAGLVLLGIFGTWFVHIFVNVGMTIGVTPITGIPLPFVSYGGTFLFVSWVAVAIAVRVAHERE